MRMVKASKDPEESKDAQRAHGIVRIDCMVKPFFWILLPFLIWISPLVESTSTGGVFSI